MQKELKYSGFSAVPSDYECPDGSLAHSLNLLTEKGSVAPVLPPKKIMSFDKGSDVVFIHKTNSYTHYIIREHDGKLKWTDSDQKDLKDLRNDISYKFSHINAVGNTLLLFTETAIIYYLWKNGSYIELGDALPDIKLSFGLVGHPRLYSVSDNSKSTFKISFNGIAEGDIRDTFSEENKALITSQVMAKLNKFIANETVNKGRFCFPFLVRYALKLYDGSLTYHSAPILMNPSTLPAPVVLWKRASGKGQYTDAELDIMLMACDLDVQTLYTADYIHLEDWSDIVKGIEIFISKPIYTYDQNGEFDSFHDTDNFQTKFIGRLYSSSPTGALTTTEDRFRARVSDNSFLNWYAEYPYSRIYQIYFSDEFNDTSKSWTYPAETLHMPEFSAEKIGETIRNTSAFYKLSSLDITQIKEKRTRGVIAIEDEYLQSLVAREVMTDDYLSHDKLRASQSFVYNSRLNLSGVKRKLYEGFPLMSQLAYKSTDLEFSTPEDNERNIRISPIDILSHDYTLDVYIKENNTDYKVTVSDSLASSILSHALGNIFSPRIGIYSSGSKPPQAPDYYKRVLISWGCYLSYPNANAYKMVIQDSMSWIDDEGNSVSHPRLVIDLQPHDFLNCAFALLDYDRVVRPNFDTSSVPAITPSPDAEPDLVDVSNKVYTSEVNNPFFFPVTGINTVGTGKILGICSAARALSEGQFGQFPLYAFTTQGVWALEVSPAGTYSARQPITRDVCINADSITQIDTAVLFATDRGIMLISGANTTCITDIINSGQFFDIGTLPGMSKLYPDGVTKVDCPFIDFLADVRITYDYINQRIILFNPNKQYAYIYSLHSKLWGIIDSRLTSPVNSYPESLVMTSDDEGNHLVDMARSDAGSVGGLIVSRPIKLDAPDTFKTIDSLIQRGYFRKDHIKTVLYGSRDLFHWHLVWSSHDHILSGFRGTPYKYFRVALLCNLSADESIYGATVQYSPRLMNKPR